MPYALPRRPACRWWWSIETSGVAGKDYVTKIYSDFEWIGERMAELIHDAFAADAKEIRVVELHGTPGGGNTIGMSRGFERKMKEYPNMKIVSSQLGDFNRATAMKSMENIIQSGVEFDAVVGHFDEDAIGAIQALMAAGKKTGSDPAKGEIMETSKKNPLLPKTGNRGLIR